MSAVTIDDEAPAAAGAPPNCFGFVLLHAAAECAVAHIRAARSAGRRSRGRARAGEIAAPLRRVRRV